MQMSKNFTAKEKVLVHLLDYCGIEDNYTQPVEVTQEGIADEIGLPQNTVSYAVRRLIKDDLLNQESNRIEGKKQKRKTYSLTDEGVEKAKDLLDEMTKTEITVDIEGEEKDIKIGNVNAYFHTNLSVIDILKKVEDGRFEYEPETAEDEFVSQLIGLPKVSEEYSIDVSEAMKWWEDGEGAFTLVGDPGMGKTSFISTLVEELRQEVNVFYFRLEPWHSPIDLWDPLSFFLVESGQHRLSSYIEASEKLNTQEALRDLKEDLRPIPALIVIEDIDRNESMENLIWDMYDMLMDLPDLKILFSSTASPDREDLITYELGTDITMITRLREYYELPSADEEILLDEIFDKYITREEFMGLTYVALMREPIGKNDVAKQGILNVNLINNLLSSPLLQRTFDSRLKLHESIEEWVKMHCRPSDMSDLHSDAAKYYEEKTAADEKDRLEEIYHEGLSEGLERVLELLITNGSDIISAGYSSPLLKVLGAIKEYADIPEEGELKGWMSFFEAEAFRRLDKEDRAVEKYNELLKTSMQSGLKIKAIHGIATIREEQGSYDEAVGEYERAISLAEKSDLEEGQKNLLGVSHLRLGEILGRKGEYEEAKENLLSAIDVLEKEEEHSLLTSAYFVLARLEKGKGEGKEALKHFKKGLEYWKEIDEIYQWVGGLTEIGSIYKVLRELENAEDYLKEAVDTSERFGYRHIKASALLSLAECYIEERDFEEAVEEANEAIEILKELGYEKEEAYAHSLLGKISMEMGDFDQAESHLAKAITIYQKLGSSYKLGLTYFSMAKLQEKEENKEGIAENYRKAILSFSGGGANWMADKVEKKLEKIPITM